MAYGLYDQAADLVRIAIAREPDRRDLKLKLLEVFFVWGNKEQFLQSAHELAATRDQAAPGEWEKIVIMGKQLAPEDPLFSGGADVSGAAAGGVDLDLEGGQSRIDFDLLGEPVPEDAAAGLDLDIGSALGSKGFTAESQTTRATDANLALHGLDFGQDASSATTRQMTQHMETPSDGVESHRRAADAASRRQPDHPPESRDGAQADAAASSRPPNLRSMTSALIWVHSTPSIIRRSVTSPDAPTLVAGLDDTSRQIMDEATQRSQAADFRQLAHAAPGGSSPKIWT